MGQTPQKDEDFGGRPGELTVELPARFDAGLYFIGTIHTPWKSRADCPKNPREAKGAPCTIDVDPRYGAALAGIEAFAQIVVIYYMDRARRDLVVQLPRHLNIPRGTFSLRSPARPNPIALSVAPLLKVEGNRLHVAGLDCLDGTPLVDLKPYLATVDDAEQTGSRTRSTSSS
jgi:tRNA-Thr(GGU) m(6)t(6)A37 methyltransferase TsaA